MFSSFRLRLVPFVATILVVTLGILAGQWQTGRAAQKQQIENAMAAQAAAEPLQLSAGTPLSDATEFRRVVLTGKFLDKWTLFLDNRPQQGVAGFHVLMPFRLNGGDRHVLVARGWLPRNPVNRTELPKFGTPAGTVTIEGRIRQNPGKVMQLGDDLPIVPNAFVQNITVQQFERAARLDMMPFLVEQTSDTSDGLVRNWTRPSTGIDKHRGYAFQWYGLALMAVVFFIVTGFKRGTDKHGAS